MSELELEGHKKRFLEPSLEETSSSSSISLKKRTLNPSNSVSFNNIPEKNGNLKTDLAKQPTLLSTTTTLAKPKFGLSKFSTFWGEEGTSSSEEEYEIPQQEPYEDKYIKLTTISALDFVSTSDPSEITSASSDSVLLVIQKIANTIFIFCLTSSFIAAIFAYFLSAYAILPWHTLYIFTTCLWGYCLYAQGVSLSLLNSVTGGRRISMGITIIQAVAYLLERFLRGRITDQALMTQSEAFAQNPFVYCGSMLALPFYVILEQILNAYQKENFRKQALLEDERANSQKAVYRAIDRFSERKGLYLRSISDQLRNTTELAITTLKQLSPPNFLSKPHEQLSACSISFPTASLSAVYTTLKAVNYITTHLGTFSLLLFSNCDEVETSNVKHKFDIGELLQNVGDSLAGVASNAKVELAIYHADYGLHHLNVIGDEAALRHALLDLLKTILKSASPGSCVEVGLQVQNSSDIDDGHEKEESCFDKDETNSSPEKVTCTIEITYNISKFRHVPGSSDESGIMMYPNANLTAKVFSFLGATLKAGAQERGKQTFEITMELMVGPPLEQSKVPNINEETLKRFPHLRISGEPSIEDLNRFSQSLRGLKVALHTMTNSFFAKHLTSYLTIWSTDISHIPIGGEELETPRSETTSVSSNFGSPVNLPRLPPRSSSLSSSREPESFEDHSNEIISHTPPTFIIIDDDVETLKEQLTQLRNSPFQGGIASMLNARGRSKRQQTPNLPQQTAAVIHFTSLANYKSVKDAVQVIFSPTTTGSFPLPQVLVIPKPAGPRRFLTALHTASNKIVVDSVYMPIATSPMSPGQQYTIGPANEYHADSESNSLDHESLKETTTGNSYFTSENTVLRSSSASSSVGSNVISRPSTTVGSPLSPRSGPGGGLLVIPKSKSSQDSRHKSNEVALSTAINTAFNSQLGGGSQFSPRISNNSTGLVSSPRIIAGSGTELPNAVNEQTTPSKLDNSPILQSPPLPIQQSSTPSGSNTRRLTATSPMTKPTGKINKTSKSSTGNLEDVIPPINVLIVEDNPINQAILSGFMRKNKIKYECASNGAEAVDKWKQGGFHLILMDIQLPVMDGIEATKEIRRLEKTQKIGLLPSTPSTVSLNSPSLSASSSIASTPLSTPQDMSFIESPPTTPIIRSPVIIVALTASSLPSDRQNALTAGCNDFLTKPVSLIWLKKKIKEWGCMQILIDFDGWRRWKKVGEELRQKGKQKDKGLINRGKDSQNGIRKSEGTIEIDPKNESSNARDASSPAPATSDKDESTLLNSNSKVGTPSNYPLNNKTSSPRSMLPDIEVLLHPPSLPTDVKKSDKDSSTKASFKPVSGGRRRGNTVSEGGLLIYDEQIWHKELRCDIKYCMKIKVPFSRTIRRFRSGKPEHLSFFGVSPKSHKFKVQKGINKRHFMGSTSDDIWGWFLRN
ncbi:hypothetical protein G9A89_008872 [Geosiphon pyriformis]|nr:hypothetical protein G9A89_008872 [Geosiphon pyriformis]